MVLPRTVGGHSLRGCGLRTRTTQSRKELSVTAILALAGALILAGVATFAYFGGYWYQLWTMKDDDDD